jgi:hypothetical protein
MSGSAVFEKLPAIPRAPTKLRGFHRGTPQQRGSQHIVATTVVNKQVSGAQKPRLDLLVAYSSLVVTYVSLAVTSLG